jgi:glyoxylase-like metal-dependent hydrolase (beta-lactamase superfamily II)
MFLAMAKITPLTTGFVSITYAQRRGQGRGLARRLAMFRDKRFTDPLPIHAWAVEHRDGVLLVDAGELATARDQRFARFHVRREEEIDRALAAAGIGTVDAVVMTHLHGDHMDGLARLEGTPVLVAEPELRAARRMDARITRRVLHQPLPSPFAPTAFAFDGPPIGAFAASHRLTADGTVQAVPAPGHTPGHTAILVDQGDHHVLLSGDASYDQSQLVDRQIDGVSPKDAVALATIDVILAHAGKHPTVVLPSHDPESVARLQARAVLEPEAVRV